MRVLISGALCALLISACSPPPVNREADAPLTIAKPVEVELYLGLWYEIARFPNSFEDDCQGVTAEYARRDDGLISVTNTCRKGARDGEIEAAEGRARIADGETNAKLEVSFFGPFWGDYWVLDHGEDYEWSLVGEPEGRYLWILSRTPELPGEVLQARLDTLRGLGYDTDALYFTPQPPVGGGPGSIDPEPEAPETQG